MVIVMKSVLMADFCTLKRWGAKKSQGNELVCFKPENSSSLRKGEALSTVALRSLWFQLTWPTSNIPSFGDFVIQKSWYRMPNHSGKDQSAKTIQVSHLALRDGETKTNTDLGAVVYAQHINPAWLCG